MSALASHRHAAQQPLPPFHGASTADGYALPDVIGGIHDGFPGHGCWGVMHERDTFGVTLEQESIRHTVRAWNLCISLRRRFLRNNDSDRVLPIRPNLARRVASARRGVVWLSGSARSAMPTARHPPGLTRD